MLTKHGELVYTHLITNIPKERMSDVELFHFYNQRQTIESFFKMAKNVYGIKNLRTRKFYGIYAFLWLAFMTHNFIVNAKKLLFAETTLVDTGMKVLVKHVGNIKALVERSMEGIRVIIPTFTKLAKQLANALAEPKYVQISLFDRQRF
ncbi:MAG: transposase [Geosporobacter ferrireducens]|nr:transposase [Geosporobacter ferrireducens]MTI55624.1 transposase [Geosporobacter ferrireducens]